ncbi:MAG TPA: hypothetical protein GX730_09915 [Chloroflexi bacterium]|nr:hypothetical protein [Chloroflexota bacterium]
MNLTNPDIAVPIGSLSGQSLHLIAGRSAPENAAAGHAASPWEPPLPDGAFP